jgi:formate-dependent nitrite reductase membrane component NrfD
MLSRLFAEVAAVLALTVIVDQARRTHSVAQMLTESFIGTVAVLITMAMAAFLVSARAGKRKRTPAAINALMLVFGVIALGLGTITWADALRGGVDPVSTCSSNY